jgi:pilus assembly protein Flp/PilA
MPVSIGAIVDVDQLAHRLPLVCASRDQLETSDRISHTGNRASLTDAPVEAAMLKTYIRFRQFVRDNSGQDMIEYALLAALIALVAVVGVRAAGIEVNTLFNDIVAALQAA